MLLTSLAMVASACIVVWVVSGYDALSSQFGEQATEYLGRYDFFVVPEDPKDATLDPDLAASLRQDPAVVEVAPSSASANPATDQSERRRHGSRSRWTARHGHAEARRTGTERGEGGR